MIHLAGIVQKRARSHILKIPTHYPLRDIFEEARLGVLGTAARTAESPNSLEDGRADRVAAGEPEREMEDAGQTGEKQPPVGEDRPRAKP